MPTVTVLLPYYNDRVFLHQSIESILNQTFTDFELILLNHATTDDSREIAHSYQDKRIRHIDMDSNLGAGSLLLMKRALRIARGKYFKTFCADDIMKPNCLGTLVEFMESNPDVDCVGANMDCIDINGKPVSFDAFHQKSEYFDINFPKFIKDAVPLIPYPTAMLRMSELKKIPLSASFIMLADVSIWANLFAMGKKIKLIENVLVDYRLHSGQTSNPTGNGTDVRLVFEKTKYISIFQSIRDTKTIKKLFNNVPYAQTLQPRDKKFIPFIVAYYYLTHNDKSFAIAGYMYIYDLLQSADIRKSLQSRFGFGIREFREIYKNIKIFDTPVPINIKEIPLSKLLRLAWRRVRKSVQRTIHPKHK